MGCVLSVSRPEQNISNIKVTSTQLQDSIMKNAPKCIYNKSEFLQILCIYKLSESKYNSNYKAILSDGELRIPAFFKSNDLNDSSIIKNLQASQYIRILSADLIFEYEQAILVISDFLYYTANDSSAVSSLVNSEDCQFKEKSPVSNRVNPSEELYPFEYLNESLPEQQFIKSTILKLRETPMKSSIGQDELVNKGESESSSDSSDSSSDITQNVHEYSQSPNSNEENKNHNESDSNFDTDILNKSFTENFWNNLSLKISEDYLSNIDQKANINNRNNEKAVKNYLEFTPLSTLGQHLVGFYVNLKVQIESSFPIKHMNKKVLKICYVSDSSSKQLFKFFMWNSQAKEFEFLKQGDVIEIQNALINFQTKNRSYSHELNSIILITACENKTCIAICIQQKPQMRNLPLGSYDFSEPKANQFLNKPCFNQIGEDSFMNSKNEYETENSFSINKFIRTRINEVIELNVYQGCSQCSVSISKGCKCFGNKLRSDKYYKSKFKVTLVADNLDILCVAFKATANIFKVPISNFDPSKSKEMKSKVKGKEFWLKISTNKSKYGDYIINEVKM